jgi:hypothetical protein
MGLTVEVKILTSEKPREQIKAVKAYPNSSILLPETPDLKMMKVYLLSSERKTSHGICIYPGAAP